MGGGWGRGSKAGKDNATRGENWRRRGVVNQEGHGWGEVGKQGIFQLGSFNFSSKMGRFGSALIRHGSEGSSGASTAVLVIHTCGTHGCVMGAVRPGVEGGRAMFVSQAQLGVQGFWGCRVHLSIWRGKERGDK